MKFLKKIRKSFQPKQSSFEGSQRYWEQRYSSGLDSGLGSYGQLAAFKADVLNLIVDQHAFQSVIEFGAGDGAQLGLARYPSYLGFDVSETAVDICRRKYAGDSSKRFELLSNYKDEKADLVLSLDIIYHLVEDPVFDQHMKLLFNAAKQMVVVYSSNIDLSGNPHVKHRNFTKWIEQEQPEWKLTQRIPNKYPYQEKTKTGSRADFFVYEMSASAP